ncbi:MAG: metallophosphoesterase [Candidatus Dadabacteria bacterium]|nr:MAG: metallophosphoesterase [Candidatus Dadabacteria bacterium]
MTNNYKKATRVSRRDFCLYSLSSAFLAALATTGIGSETTEQITLTKQTIKIKNLPPAFNNYKIAFLTDLHFSAYLPHALIERAVEITNQQEPNLILLGGDYIWLPDHPPVFGVLPYRNTVIEAVPASKKLEALYSETGSMLKYLKASDGIFGVLGNHDRWEGAKLCTNIFSENGIKILVNESEEIVHRGDALMIYGSDDFWTGTPSLPMNLTQENQTRILLSHNPDFVADSIKKGFSDFSLALCGHTHGGQIKLPLVGAPFYNVKNREFREGLVEKRGYNVYTSRGIGVVEIPVRINCPPEVALINLTAA